MNGILLDRFGPIIVGEIVAETIGYVSMITDFDTIIRKVSRIWCLSDAPVGDFIENFPSLL